MILTSSTLSKMIVSLGTSGNGSDGESFSYERLNETANIPLDFRSPLYRELTLDALLLLGARSRLDLKLWSSVIKRLPSCDISTLRERTVLVNTAKFAALMASPSA